MVDRIRTEVDPAYQYAYEQTKFVPPEGKTLLIVGQAKESIREHVDAFPNQARPGGWAAYWGIPSLDGVTGPSANPDGGTQDHQGLVDEHPNTVIQSGLWMVGKWDVAKNTALGIHDDIIRGFSAWVKRIDRPLYLRIGYEFDGPHNDFEPDEYVRAYRHVVDVMREEGVENVAYVWHSYAAGPHEGHPLPRWYPGDDYVDWVAISAFGHMYSPTVISPMEDVLEFARARRKPVMIAESSPVHGISSSNLGAWDWFVNYFSMVYQKNIKAISFIDENWQRYANDSEWKDARLRNNPAIAAAWFRETNKERYLKQSPTLFEQLGYSP